jgi:hypothetical protein
MSKLGVPWSVAHKHVREKNIFVRAKSEAFVVQDVAYKIEAGDLLCIAERIKEESVTS